MKNSGLQVARAAEREIVMTRVFDAPRSLVFDGLTRPEHLKRWFGPHGWSLPVCEIDLKVGGAWHYVVRRDNGTELAMRGVYREIVAPERIVHTESYDDPAWGELVVTTVLIEQGGKTTLTLTVLHPSQEICDANAGMEHGVAESYDKLAEYLATIA